VEQLVPQGQPGQEQLEQLDRLEKLVHGDQRALLAQARLERRVQSGLLELSVQLVLPGVDRRVRRDRWARADLQARPDLLVAMEGQDLQARPDRSAQKDFREIEDSLVPPDQRELKEQQELQAPQERRDRTPRDSRQRSETERARPSRSLTTSALATWTFASTETHRHGMRSSRPFSTPRRTRWTSSSCFLRPPMLTERWFTDEVA
jgi:hypothetical protein